MNENIINLLTCPQSQEDIQLMEGELYSSSTSYPLLNGIPWLFKEAEHAFLEWATKTERFIEEENSSIKHLQSILTSPTHPLTKKRLSKLLDAKSKNLKFMSKILSDLLGHQAVSITPSTQQIHSYFQLLFRDWVWGEGENKEYFKFVQESITQASGNILILGSGASNLSYELSKAYPEKTIISFDHNPFLLFTARKIFNGEEVKLSDYTYYPKDLDSTSKAYKIKVPKLESSNHQFILGSFPDLPFKKESFEHIIAPWFFDILDTDFQDSIKYTLNFLKKEGSLLMYGPANVHKKNIIAQYTPQEIQSRLSPLFKESYMNTKILNYLNNPLTSQNRIENILFFKGLSPLKSKETQAPKAPLKKSVLNFTPSFQNYKNMNEVFFNILKHIKKDITAKDLAIKIKKEFSFTEAEALHHAKSFIGKINQDID